MHFFSAGKCRLYFSCVSLGLTLLVVRLSSLYMASYVIYLAADGSCYLQLRCLPLDLAFVEERLARECS